MTIYFKYKGLAKIA